MRNNQINPIVDKEVIIEMDLSCFTKYVQQSDKSGLILLNFKAKYVD